MMLELYVFFLRTCHVSKNMDHIFKVELDYLTQSTTKSAKRSKGLAGLLARFGFMKKDRRNTKPDFFAIIFILMFYVYTQVSRARCLEAAHHNQHHVPSSGSQISNMDHLIIFFSSQTATGFHAMRGYTVLFQEVLTVHTNALHFYAAIRIT